MTQKVFEILFYCFYSQQVSYISRPQHHEGHGYHCGRHEKSVTNGEFEVISESLTDLVGKRQGDYKNECRNLDRWDRDVHFLESTEEMWLQEKQTIE